MYSVTTATRKVMGLTKRIRAIQGGTSASKTISVLLVLINIAQSAVEPLIISVVAETIPHLKIGAMRDFLNIMQTHNYYKDERWNKSDRTYTFETGAKIEFFSVDQPRKVRGPRRHILFVNEANNIDLESFDHLEVRTRDIVFLDWNPTVEFWFYTDVLRKRDDVDHLVLTYLDNEALDPAIVRSIEQRKGNKSWWKVYGEGQLGEVEGKIYKDWEVIDEIPHEARLERRGLDFGYSHDPTAVMDIYKWNGAYILDELLYQIGMPNREIAEFLKLNSPQTITIGDSAEPKSIDELKLYGINIIGANKGPGSVNQGIQFVQGQRIYITKRSANAIKEYRNYLWLVDKNGRITTTPQPGNDHAMDAIRYGFNGFELPTIIYRPPKANIKLTKFG